jgi:ketosteroid isomerase-like protein
MNSRRRVNSTIGCFPFLKEAKMRQLFVAIVFAFVIPISVVAQTSNIDPDLETAHRLWTTYFSHPCSGSVSLIDAVVAQDFTFIGVHGERASRRDFMREVGCSSSELSSSDDVQMRVFDDIAVVTGRLTIKPVGNGVPNEARMLRYTNVYRKSSKRWELVHLQFTRIVDN